MIAIVPGRICGSVCVASTCSTSLVPMPNASAPNAPCVEVWLSPHTIVMPGCVRPCSGPITCTMPWPGIAHRVAADAELLAVARERRDLRRRDRVLERPVEAGGRHVVVHRRDGEVGPAHAAAREAQPVERLRRRDLVHEVQIDVEQVGLARRPSARRAGPRPSRKGSGPCSSPVSLDHETSLSH